MCTASYWKATIASATTCSFLPRLAGSRVITLARTIHCGSYNGGTTMAYRLMRWV